MMFTRSSLFACFGVAVLGTALGLSPAAAQTETPTVATVPQQSAETPRGPAPYRKYHLGSSAFMLMNLVPFDNPPRFAMLTFGVRLTPKDVLSFEAITWQYHEPGGVPYGQKGASEWAFPGTVRDVGIGVAYQRFLWKGAYAAVHATPFYQTYLDEQGDRIQSGFQLFMTGRVGYHLAFARNRVFIEPSAAFTAWPVNTNLPDAFAVLEDQHPDFLLIEPGLHVGVKF